MSQLGTWISHPAYALARKAGRPCKQWHHLFRVAGRCWGPYREVKHEESESVLLHSIARITK